MSIGSPANLVLGTVQFGLTYGVAGRGTPVPEAEVRAILERAAAAGIGWLDTAPVYGDIEARLSALCEGLSLRVISKIAPSPEGVDAPDAVRQSVIRSRERLGDRLAALLFHRPDDLLRRDGDALWRAAVDAGEGIRIGASTYDPETVGQLRGRHGLAVAQLPASALDQRACADGGAHLGGVEIHARSIFLQGLLLMAADDVRSRLPWAGSAHARWLSWCRDRSLAPVAAALAIARGLPGIRYCLVGVDRLAHLDEILSATAVEPICAPELACDDLNVIDPRRWAAARA